MHRVSNFVHEKTAQLKREYQVLSILTESRNHYRNVISQITELSIELIRLQCDILIIFDHTLSKCAQGGFEILTSDEVSLVETDLKLESIQSPGNPCPPKIPSQPYSQYDVRNNDRLKNDAPKKTGIHNKLIAQVEAVVVESHELKLLMSEELYDLMVKMPLAFESSIGSSSSAIRAVSELLSAAEIVRDCAAAVTGDSSPALHLMSEAVRRVGKLVEQLTERLAASVQRFQEAVAVDNLLRQDWKASSAYMRDRKASPGVVVMQSGVRWLLSAFFCDDRWSRRQESERQQQQIQDNEPERDEQTDLLMVVVVLQCLVLSCIALARLYLEVLTPSRVRLNQWRIDLTYFIYCSRDTLLWMRAHLPVMTIREIAAVDPKRFRRRLARYCSEGAGQRDTSRVATPARAAKTSSSHLINKRDTLLRELAAVLKHVIAAVFLISESSQTLPPVLKAVASLSSGKPDVICEEGKSMDTDGKGEGSSSALDALLSVFLALSFGADERLSKGHKNDEAASSSSTGREVQSRARGRPCLDRLADLLHGTGLATAEGELELLDPAEEELFAKAQGQAQVQTQQQPLTLSSPSNSSSASSVRVGWAAVVWRRIVSMKVVDPFSWLAAYLAGPDGKQVLAMMIGHDHPQDISLSTFLRHFLRKRYSLANYLYS